jgi:hypothetical protein
MMMHKRKRERSKRTPEIGRRAPWIAANDSTPLNGGL